MGYPVPSTNRRKHRNANLELVSLPFLSFTMLYICWNIGTDILGCLLGSLASINENFWLPSTIGSTIWCIVQVHVWTWGYFDRISCFVALNASKAAFSLILHVDVLCHEQLLPIVVTPGELAAYLPIFDVQGGLFYWSAPKKWLSIRLHVNPFKKVLSVRIS